MLSEVHRLNLLEADRVLLCSLTSLYQTMACLLHIIPILTSEFT